MQDLLEAVLASPDEDAPRLVYADALMERNASRGELIVLQIRLARERMGEGDRLRLALRARDLVREHSAEFLARYHELNAGCVFRRGFVEQVTAPAAALTSGDAFARLMAEEPVGELVLLEASDDTIERLASSPLLGRVRSLTCRGTMTSRGAGAVARSAFVERLGVLDLGGTRLGAFGCQVLADSAMLSPSVVALNATGAADGGAIALAEGRALRRCRRLLLARNRIGRRGGEAIARSPMLEGVEHLALTGNDELDPTTVSALRARYGLRVAV